MVSKERVFALPIRARVGASSAAALCRSRPSDGSNRKAVAFHMDSRRKAVALRRCLLWSIGLLLCSLLSEQGFSIFPRKAKAHTPEVEEHQEPETKWLSSKLEDPKVVTFLALMAFSLLSWCRHRSIQASRRLKRPYSLTDEAFLKDADAAALQKRLESAIGFLQEAVLLPIDKRLPGRPFEFDMAVFPCKPTVLMIGNHSSGKSTFINRMMGVQVHKSDGTGGDWRGVQGCKQAKWSEVGTAGQGWNWVGSGWDRGQSQELVKKKRTQESY